MGLLSSLTSPGEDVVRAARGPADTFLAGYRPRHAKSDRAFDLLVGAAYNPDPEARARILGRLLDDGIDAAQRRDDGLTVLHCLVSNAGLTTADAPLLERVLNAGVDVNSRGGKHGETAIEMLAGNGGLGDETVAGLLEVILARDGVDLLQPSYANRTTYENLRRMTLGAHGRRHAALALAEQYLTGRGRPIPEHDPDPAPLADLLPAALAAVADDIRAAAESVVAAGAVRLTGRGDFVLSGTCVVEGKSRRVELRSGTSDIAVTCRAERRGSTAMCAHAVALAHLADSVPG